MALHRFLARRGSVQSIWSDNGTYFVCANNELHKALKEMHNLKIKNYLQGNGTDWILWHENPPRASHMGGVWECQIRTARGILEELLKTHGQSLNDEALRTLMAKVESIINSRPLTVETLSDTKRQILSFLHLVFLQNQIYIPEEDRNACSIIQRSFGTDGEKSFCKVYKPDKNGMIKGEILNLVTF